MATYKHSLLIVVLLIAGIFPAFAAKQAYNILFIQSYMERDTWAREMNEGLRKGFEDAGLTVNITTEYLNSRYWRVAGEEEIMRRICARARERKTDLIVTSNDEALYTLLTCGDSLPSTVPVVFTGVQFPNYKLLKSYPNATGSTTPLAYDQLLNTIKSVFPNRKTVIVLSEETTLGRWGLQAFKEEWRNFLSENSGYDIKEFNVTVDPLTDIVTEIQLSRTVSHSVVVVPYWGLFMPSIAKVSKAPTFSTNGSALMQGGFCIAAPNAYDAAVEAASRAAKILKGANPTSFEITQSANQLTYDFKQLEFFHVSKDRIPKNGVIINEPYMNKYGLWFILLYALILGLLIFVVVRLIAANRKESRRRVHAQTKLLVQERLVAQRNEFDNVFHSIRDAVITYDMDYRIHFVNRATLDTLDLPIKVDSGVRPYEGQLTGSICTFINNGESILPSLLKKVHTEGVTVTIPENTFVQSIHSKKYFPISGEIVPLRSKNKQIGMVLSFRDISSEALQKRFYNLAVVESFIYPWQFNREENTFTFPAEYTARMGFEEGDIKREDIDKNVHPDDLPETHRLFSTILEGNAHNVRLTFRQRNATGSYEWWEFRVSTIGGLSDDIPYGILGVCQSIQRYKSTEDELIAARDRALQADKLKTAFLANMSHEIRTPLNAIVGFSDLLKDIHMFSEEEINQFVSTINKNCELLLALISDILDLSRVESGTMDFQFSPYFLPIIMQEIYDSQRLNMPPDVVLVKKIPDGSEKTIMTDSVRLKQVLNNLINNAAKFTTSGSITFGYTEDEPGYTTLFVEDTGIGLSEEDRQRIFERFYKVDNFTQGAGLGLSITQTIVSRLRGTIDVESEKGKGTRFIVRIPDDNR